MHADGGPAAAWARSTGRDTISDRIPRRAAAGHGVGLAGVLGGSGNGNLRLLDATRALHPAPRPLSVSVPKLEPLPGFACRGRYSDLAHNASAEAVATAVHAVRIALTATGSRHRDLGVARFAEYSATPADWRSYLSGWLHPGRNNVTPASAAAGRDRLRLGLSLSGWPDLGYPSVSAARMPAPFVPGATPRSRLVPGTP